MILPYTLTAGGFLLCLFSFYPISVSEWLPRWTTWLAGTWFLVAGIVLLDLRAAMRETK